jgi:hypothetical protein
VPARATATATRAAGPETAGPEAAEPEAAEPRAAEPGAANRYWRPEGRVPSVTLRSIVAPARSTVTVTVSPGP